MMREAEFAKRFEGTSPDARLDEAWGKYFATEGPFGAWAALKERTNWMVARVVGPHVLDVGCGSGLLSHLAAKRSDVTFVRAVDPLTGACDLAKLHTEGQTVAVARGWAEDMYWCHEETEHTVLLGETLQHALNPTEALREAHRVLVPGGAIVVSVPEGGPPAPDHLRRFTRDQLIALVEMAGFRVDEFKRIAPWLCLVAQSVEG